MLWCLKARLDRLRLRLGVFFWWNYAWIEYIQGLDIEHDIWCVRWKRPPYPRLERKSYKSKRETIRHIRRCVRLGVRP